MLLSAEQSLVRFAGTACQKAFAAAVAKDSPLTQRLRLDETSIAGRVSQRGMDCRHAAVAVETVDLAKPYIQRKTKSCLVDDPAPCRAIVAAFAAASADTTTLAFRSTCVGPAIGLQCRKCWLYPCLGATWNHRSSRTDLLRPRTTTQLCKLEKLILCGCSP